MTRRLLSLYLALVLSGAMGWALTDTHQPQFITEDSPGWDCRTMGNRGCGR